RLGHLIDRLVACVTEGDPVDVASDLDSGESEACLDLLEIARSKLGFLKRRYAEPFEALRFARNHFRDKAIDVVAHDERIRSLEPIGEKLWQGRENVDCNAVAIHVVDTARNAPGTGIDVAKRLVVDDKRRGLSLYLEAWPASVSVWQRI